MKKLIIGVVVLIVIVVGAFLFLRSPSLTGFTKVSEKPFNLATAGPLPGPLYLFQTAEVVSDKVEVTYILAEWREVGRQAPDCQDCGILEPVPLSNFTAKGASWSIDIPEGLTLISGETSWTGNINDGEMKTINIVLKPEREGIWDIKARANSGIFSGKSVLSSSYNEFVGFVLLYKENKILLNPTCVPGYFDWTTLQCVTGPQPGQRVQP